MTRSIAARARSSAGSVIGRSLKTGAYPAVRSKALRSRSGMSRCSARFSTISREGAARPLSMKLKCFCEMFASQARASWLSRRCSRHDRTREPADVAVWFMTTSQAAREPIVNYLGGSHGRKNPRGYYLEVNRCDALFRPSLLLRPSEAGPANGETYARRWNHCERVHRPLERDRPEAPHGRPRGRMGRRRHLCRSDDAGFGAE